jgi:hypothetical protein
MAELAASVYPAGEGGGEIDVLVWDGRDVFSGGVDGVRAVLDEGWDAIRGVLHDGLLVVLIAPPPGDAHAEAARPAAASISAE